MTKNISKLCKRKERKPKPPEASKRSQDELNAFIGRAEGKNFLKKKPKG